MRVSFVWIKMVFDFIKRIFGLVDESSRKRPAEELNHDCPSIPVLPKKHCRDPHDSHYGGVTYGDENDEEIQFIGESNYSQAHTKDRANGGSCHRRKQTVKLFTRTPAKFTNRENCAAKMNGKDSKTSRVDCMPAMAISIDSKNSTLSKTYELRDKQAYSQLLQNFLPSRVQVIRNKPLEDDATRRSSITEVIDLEKYDTPSTSLVGRHSWNDRSHDFYTAHHASTPLKSCISRETKPKSKNEQRVSIHSARRSLNVKAKDDDMSILAARKIQNTTSGPASRKVPEIKIDNVKDASPVVSPVKTPAEKTESHPSTSHVVRTDSVDILQTNTLRDNLANKAVMKQDFVPRICENYKDRMEQRMKEVEELKRMTCLMSKHNRLTREAALEEQLARSMRLCEAVLDETEQLEEDALPTLTPAMLQEIKNALVPNPPNECLVESFGLRITRKDIHTLYGLNWLNDEVINFYMNLLIARGNGSNDKYPRVHAMNTFFYPKLINGGHASLKRWTRKIDVFAQDILVVPIHLGIHWCMSIVDFRDKSIRYFDSMGGSNPKCLAALRQYLEDESMDKKKKPFDTNDWKLISMKNIPQQMNGSDCGVFSCMFAEFLSADKKVTFTQQDMPYFRNKMVYEILKAKLL